MRKEAKEPTIDERKQILAKLYWSTHDISLFLGIGEEKARKLKQKFMIDYQESICSFNENLVNSEMFLNTVVNTTRNNEIELLNKLCN